MSQLGCQIEKKEEQLKKANRKYNKAAKQLVKKNSVYKEQLNIQLEKYEKKFQQKYDKLLKKMELKKQKYNFDEDYKNYKDNAQKELTELKETSDQAKFSIIQNKHHLFKSLKQQEKIKTLKTINDYYNKKMAELNEDHELALENFALMKKDLNQGNKIAIERLHISIVQNVINKWEKKEFLNLRKEKKAQLKSELNSISNKKSSEYYDKKKEISDLTLAIYNKQEWNYIPGKIKCLNFKNSIFNKTITTWQNTKQIVVLVKNYSVKDWINIKVWEIPLYLMLLMLGVVIAAIATNALQVDMISALAVLFVIATIGGAIFNRIPIWNKYVGGGLLGTMFIGAILVATNIIPKDSNTYNVINTWFSKQDFLSFYICVLLVGSVLTIPRKMIIKAMSGFVGMIIIGCLFATGLALVFGSITGHSIKDIILNYLLPTLSDGNGGGIQPMDKIAKANGYNNWISSALAISTLSSVLSVIAAAILNGVGKSYKGLSGEGRLMQREIHVVEKKITPTDRNVAGGLMLIVTLYVLANIISLKILPESVIKVNIPNFAWMIILCLILNLANIVPATIKGGTAHLNSFVSKQMTWLLMFGVGIVDLDLTQFIKALNPAALLICLGIVIGVIAGPMIFAKFINFYQIESAISAGLCMSAQGGAGAIACLGASNRMELMAYAQITCRIAGSLVLVVASFAFSAWPDPALH